MEVVLIMVLYIRKYIQFLMCKTLKIEKLKDVKEINFKGCLNKNDS
jgi:hypothetical protein